MTPREFIDLVNRDTGFCAVPLRRITGEDGLTCKVGVNLDGMRALDLGTQLMQACNVSKFDLAEMAYLLDGCVIVKDELHQEVSVVFPGLPWPAEETA